MPRRTEISLCILLILGFVFIINTQYIPLCESLNEVENNDQKRTIEESKSRRVRALCDAIYSTRDQIDNEELDTIPDFDVNRMNSDDDANQILKRFRRSRFSSSRSSSSSSSSRSSSSSSGSRSGSSSSSSGSRFFGGSRSSSSSSSSGGSRIFGSRSSSSSSGSRIFSRSSGTSSSSSTGSRGGIFSRSSSSSSSTGNKDHRVRQAIRSIIRKPATSGSGVPATSGGLSGAGGSKPSLSDKIRKITHGSGGSSNTFRSYGSGISGGGFGTGGSSGSGGNAWVRAGKKFLPYAVRFGKRYYQRRKYQKGMYAAAGAGAGYYAGSRMSGHHGNYYPNNYYGYPPVVDDEQAEIDGKPPTVFYCIQEDLNTTLVNQTLDAEGFGVCNISGELVTCPIEIECKTSEADTCCEDEQGKPMCCGGPIPNEYASGYGGYGDDLYDAAESFSKILNTITAISVLLATICYTIWRREE